MKDPFSQRFADYVVTHPWRIFLLSIVVIMFTASGARFLEFTNDYRVFFSEDNPELKAFEAMQDIYTKTDNVLFVVEPKSSDVFSKKTLDVIEQLTDQSWQIPYSTRVDSITNFQHTIAQDDDLQVSDLVENAFEFTDNELAYVRDVALSEPLLVNRLVSKQAHVTGVNITIQLPGKALTEVPEVANFARQIAAEIEATHPDHKIHITGLAMMNNAFGESSQNDMQTLVPMMFLTIIVVLGVLLRSVSAVLGVVIMISSTIMFAMGGVSFYEYR